MNTLNDLMIAINEIKKTPGLTVLTENMKKSCVEGITDIFDNVALKAFDYYKTHEFEPTQQIIPVMRKVVEIALEKGVV